MQQTAGNPDDTRGVGAPHRKRHKPTGPSPEQSVLCLTPTIREMCHLPRSSASLPRWWKHTVHHTRFDSACSSGGPGICLSHPQVSSWSTGLFHINQMPPTSDPSCQAVGGGKQNRPVFKVQQHLKRQTTVSQTVSSWC